MIIGPDFVWLHFPKCAGTACQAALRILLAGRPDIHFDELNPSNVIWHEPVFVRQQRDPTLDVSHRRIICNFRRLPSWLLSRVHYEVSRSARRAPTRAMLLKGCFYEQDGLINTPDKYLVYRTKPRVDTWVRTEHLAEDLSAAFGLEKHLVEQTLTTSNETVIPYVKSLAFWFSDEELCSLYAANPVWAELEKKVYGSLPLPCERPS